MLPIQPIAPQLAATRFGPQRLVGPLDDHRRAMRARRCRVRFAPTNRHRQLDRQCPESAKRGLEVVRLDSFLVGTGRWLFYLFGRKQKGGVDETLMMLFGMAFRAATGLGLYSVFR
jgi:hypothetical protein